MPRLTDTLCKSGGARNTTVNFKKFLNYTKTFSNHMMAQPNILGNHVSEANIRNKDAACREEMLLLMSCWKKHEFQENTCADEYKKFSKCNADARMRLLKQQQFSDSSELGKLSEDGRMNPKQTNKLLRMYPQPPYKITITHSHGYPLDKELVFTQKSEENTQRSMMKNLWSRKTKVSKK